MRLAHGSDNGQSTVPQRFTATRTAGLPRRPRQRNQQYEATIAALATRLAAQAQQLGATGAWTQTAALEKVPRGSDCDTHCRSLPRRLAQRNQQYEATIAALATRDTALAAQAQQLEEVRLAHGLRQRP